jgi:hypothetical protein
MQNSELRTASQFVFFSPGLLLTFALCSMTVSHVVLGAPTSAAANAPGESLSSTDCGSAWRIVPSPNLGSGNNELYGLGVVSANDIWAVGRFSDAAGYKTLAIHWDGSVWNIVTTPNVGSNFNQLYSVAAVSSNNVWTVGASSDNNVLFQPLIEHWDGMQWSTVANPLAPGTSAFIYGIASLAANDIWAVGYIQVGFSAQQPLAVHWDGSSWSLVTTPSTSPANNDILWSVTALSPGDVWAAGYSVDRVSGNYNTLIEHWNGSAWSIVPSPNPSGSIYNFLWGIAAASPNDIWVMGRAYNGAIYPGLFEHWNGSAWNIVSSGPTDQSYTELYGAVALSSTDIWAVGREGDGFNTNLTLIEHWDGSAWSRASHPEPAGSTESYLNATKAASANDLWTVGAYLKNDSTYRTLIERYSTIPCPNAVVSRKNHGTAGSFDIDLPFTGNPGIECRSGGANGDHTLVFSFPNALSTVGSVTASATTSGGTAPVTVLNTSGIGTDTHQYFVNLTGVPNASHLSVALNSVTDAAGDVGNVSAHMDVLLGDVNASGRTDSGDVTAVRNHTVAVPDQQTFRFDVNVSGRIDAGDVTATRNASVTVLP